MVYLIDDLEKAGLVQRVPDPGDRRARRLVATKRGGELLLTLDGRLAAAEANLLAPLDDEARDTFRSHVRALATQADVEPQADACTPAEHAGAKLPRRRT